MWFIKSEDGYRAGEPGTVTLSFALKEEDTPPITIHLEPPLTSTDESIMRPRTVSLPESFTLTPDERRQQFEIPLELLGGGKAKIEGMATATESDGAVFPAAC